MAQARDSWLTPRAQDQGTRVGHVAITWGMLVLPGQLAIGSFMHLNQPTRMYIYIYMYTYPPPNEHVINLAVSNQPTYGILAFFFFNSM